MSRCSRKATKVMRKKSKAPRLMGVALLKGKRENTLKWISNNAKAETRTG